MKHYLITDNSSMGVVADVDKDNVENITVRNFNDVYAGIRDVYLIPEDGTFQNEKVKKGDIIIKTYSFEKIPTRYFVIRNKEFSKHLFEREAIMNRRTEEIPSGTNCAMG
jgi:hypothetical protein